MANALILLQVSPPLTLLSALVGLRNLLLQLPLKLPGLPSMAITQCGKFPFARLWRIIMAPSANRMPVAGLLLAQLPVTLLYILVWEMNRLLLLQKQKQVLSILHLFRIVLPRLLLAVCALFRLVHPTPIARHVLVALSATVLSLSTMILLSAYVVKFVSITKSNRIPPTRQKPKRTNTVHHCAAAPSVPLLLS